MEKLKSWTRAGISHVKTAIGDKIDKWKHIRKAYISHMVDCYNEYYCQFGHFPPSSLFLENNVLETRYFSPSYINVPTTLVFLQRTRPYS
jgi:hypothetical protein